MPSKESKIRNWLMHRARLCRCAFSSSVVFPFYSNLTHHIIAAAATMKVTDSYGNQYQPPDVLQKPKSQDKNEIK